MAASHTYECAKCSNLAELHARAFTAFQAAQMAYREALRSGNVSYDDLEEELKQTTAACRFIGDARRKHSVQSHPVAFELECAA